MTIHWSFYFSQNVPKEKKSPKLAPESSLGPWSQSLLGWEDPLEEGMASHSSILA